MNEKPKAPSPFSSKNPNLQLVWDATSISAFEFCPRYYQYSILDGWRLDNVHLSFGKLAASSFEVYKKAIAAKKGKDQATFEALRYALDASWEGDKPWGGHYDDMWHCTGTEPYKNSKGNRAKCPYSHKGKWFPAPAPEQCGECGSEIEIEHKWIPDDRIKNRKTLLRLVFAYCSEGPETVDDGLMPLVFPNGLPAVELSFKMPLPFKTKQGEPFVLAGHLDSIMSDGYEAFIADNKTTKKSLTKSFWDGYNPNTQVDTYDFAGSTLYQNMKIRGVMIEGAQGLVDGVELGSHIIYRTEGQREEYLRDLGKWLKLAEEYAEDGYWPMNRRNCWLCPFKTICRKEPNKREMYLKADFYKEHWNPLEER